MLITEAKLTHVDFTLKLHDDNLILVENKEIPQADHVNYPECSKPKLQDPWQEEKRQAILPSLFYINKFLSRV